MPAANPIAAGMLPIPPYPKPRFDPFDYYDPLLSQRVVDNSPQRPHSPYRRPPVIHLHWMWLLLRVIGVLLQAVNWFTRRVDSHRHKPLLSHLPVSSYYDVGLTKAEMDGGMGDAALRAILPGFIVSMAEWFDSYIVVPMWSSLHSMRVMVVPSQWRGVSQRPALYLVYALSTMVYGALNTVLAVLTALTGQKRSWVNIFDDNFDLQYLIKDVQPAWTTTTLPPTITKSGIGRTLETPDLLYPYDLYPTMGFTPTITPLDVVMALISKLGYEEVDPQPGTVQSICEEWKIDYVTQFQYDDTTARLDGAFTDVTFQSRAFLFRYMDCAVICFRGTYPTAALQWLTDFAAQQVVYPGQERTNSRDAVRVHRGFFSALGLPVVGDPSYPETMFTSIVRQLSEMPNISRVYVTGHSLGAALATLFSYALKTPWPVRPLRGAVGLDSGRHRFRMFNARTKKESTDTPSGKASAAAAAAPAPAFAQHSRVLKATSTSPPPRNEALASQVRAWQEDAAKKLVGVYTYGSPRVGNDIFANEFDRYFHDIPVHRFINANDIVTHMPPPIAATDDDTHPDVLFDYAHVDGLRYIDTTQRVLFCVNQDAPPTRWLALNIFDHVPGDYVRHINAALVAQVRDVHVAKMYDRLQSGRAGGGGGGAGAGGGVGLIPAP